MQRKACIEFAGLTRLRITTSFKQKEFNIADIAKNCNYVDLISLKLCDPDKQNGGLAFYAEVIDGLGTVSDPYYIGISVMTSVGVFEEIAVITHKNGPQVYFVDLP